MTPEAMGLQSKNTVNSESDLQFILNKSLTFDFRLHPAQRLLPITKNHAMKSLTLSLTVFFAVFAGHTFAQVTADAGPDVYACVNEEAIIGGAPTATGGTPPYTFTWEASYTLGSGNFVINLSASDFLNDTTVANPEYIPQNLSEIDTVEFMLTVTDATGITSIDTVQVYSAAWAFHFGQMYYTINAGDSVFLSGWENVYGGFPPYEYLWRPNHGLTDSTSLSFWAKPEESVAYYLTKTDSIGCEVSGPLLYFVNVESLSSSEFENAGALVRTYPNPTKDFMTIEINLAVSGEFTFRLFSEGGKLVDQLNFNQNTFEMNLSNHPAGAYIYEVTNRDGWREKGRVVIL